MTNHDSGYENLKAYQQGVVIYDLNDRFCKRFLPGRENRRFVEQMQQAARSGKQNIAEGSAGVSLQSYIKLAGVGRASFVELLEDYKDYVRVRQKMPWDKEDPRILTIRVANKGGVDSVEGWSQHLDNDETFANLLITLINQEIYMLGQLIKALEAKFEREGGFTENLHQKRIDYRRGEEGK